eukprot:scaffold36259_cov75-Attheya_sp.AAC.1
MPSRIRTTVPGTSSSLNDDTQKRSGDKRNQQAALGTMNKSPPAKIQRQKAQSNPPPSRLNLVMPRGRSNSPVPLTRDCSGWDNYRRQPSPNKAGNDKNYGNMPLPEAFCPPPFTKIAHRTHNASDLEPYAPMANLVNSRLPQSLSLESAAHLSVERASSQSINAVAGLDKGVQDVPGHHFEHEPPSATVLDGRENEEKSKHTRTNECGKKAIIHSNSPSYYPPPLIRGAITSPGYFSPLKKRKAISQTLNDHRTHGALERPQEHIRSLQTLSFADESSTQSIDTIVKYDGIVLVSGHIVPWPARILCTIENEEQRKKDRQKKIKTPNDHIGVYYFYPCCDRTDVEDNWFCLDFVDPSRLRPFELVDLE